MPVNTQFSFSGGSVSSSLYGRADLSKFDISCRIIRNTFVHAEGGASNRAGLEYISQVHDSTRKTRLISFRFNTEQTYALEFGHQSLRILKDGALVFEPSVVVTAVSQADPCEVTIGAHSYAVGQEVFIDSVVGMTELNGRFYRVNSVTATTVTLEDQFGVNVDSTAFTAYVSGGTASVAPVFTTVYDEDDLALLKFTQNADTLTVTHPDYTNMYDITRTAHHTWSVVALSFTPGISAPTGFSATPSTGASGVIRNYVVTAIDAATGEESVASSSNNADHDLASGSKLTNDCAWTLVSGVSGYRVYCDDTNSGVFGFVGSSTNITFEDNFITPDMTRTPPETATPFSGADNTPKCITYHQQRRIYAGPNSRPSTWFASRIALPTNMNVSAVLQGDDAITFNVLSDDVHEIRDMKSYKKNLFLFTSSGVWNVVTGESIAFTADNITSDQQETWGVSNVPALKAGNSLLYVQDDLRTIRDLRPQSEFGASDEVGDELTLLARHLFLNKEVKEWAYARDPHSIVWAVMTDGTVNGLTYIRKHQVWAWHQHVTDGVFESVCSMPETTAEYGVYFVVKRTINGTEMRYVERLRGRDFLSLEDSFLVDSGLTFDVPVTITGATAADPVVVTTSGAHSFSNGDLVDIVDVVGMSELNGMRYKAANVTSNTLELQDTDAVDIDGSAFSAYTSAGVIRKAVTAISGLEHLEGKTVSIMADGGTSTPAIVTGGSITIANAASRIHVGLPYQSDLQTLGVDLTALNGYGDSHARRKSIPTVKIRVKDTVGLKVGRDATTLEDYKHEAVGANSAQALVNGVIAVDLRPDWEEHDGTVYIRQDDPLPFTILSIMPEVRVAPNP